MLSSDARRRTVEDRGGYGRRRHAARPPDGPRSKGEDLIDADQVAEQISLDDAREARLAAEAAVDRVRDKYGPGIIGPAAAVRRAS